MIRWGRWEQPETNPALYGMAAKHANGRQACLWQANLTHPITHPWCVASSLVCSPCLLPLCLSTHLPKNLIIASYVSFYFPNHVYVYMYVYMPTYAKEVLFPTPTPTKACCMYNLIPNDVSNNVFYSSSLGKSGGGEWVLE